MAYSKAKLKSNGDRAFPCFRPFLIGNLSDTFLPTQTLLYVSVRLIFINLRSFLGIPNSMRILYKTSQDPIQITMYLQFSHNQSLNIYQKQAYTLHAKLLNSKPNSATAMYAIYAIMNHSQSCHFLCKNATGIKQWNMLSSRLPMCKCLWSCKKSKLNIPVYMSGYYTFTLKHYSYKCKQSRTDSAVTRQKNTLAETSKS